MKILFVDMHREGRTPSQRFRYEQYLDFLAENKIQWEHSYLLNAEDDQAFYKPGNYLRKFLILVKSIKKRFQDIKKANKDVDVVFIQREAFMLSTTYFEKKFAESKAKVIFDFDDAIWLPQESKSSSPNKNLSWLKNPDKTKEIIALSDVVIAGNEYLADYARQYNENVVIIPTTIDTDVYKPKKEDDYKKDQICIGWSGSKTTIDHFEEALPVLTRIKNKYGNKVYFKVIGDGDYHYPPLNINGRSWCSETEVEDLREFDIGIMPLPDDEWSKGKCGLKGLQYMALGIPTLMSPVGVNNDIIRDGENGFLPQNERDWEEKISLLVEDESLRQEMGEKGIKTVKNSFSVRSQALRYLALFKFFLSSKY